ncbi:rhodanese-like domain-containing protein [Micromonospora sp. 4G57]|uniref:Rhodanese-like domain-containing protein n=2 Tax=Micromonospora sicca TaxID=2202420 RepID=A0ABU5JH54_9ACTN|nr:MULTISPECIES: rhodanese-like domain-containing protein [unclassified Micromonospora]MDZ5446156.1 rhodanese-like domain-containing protein [Micromonospora sp. 4G57]MDZ5491960.1 rhodanese-like domain-containing protein [Micromonospora sp. 4G53]
MPHTQTRTDSCPVPPPGSRGIDEVLAAARARLRRLDPEQAHLAYRSGALLVDIRPAGQRAAHGTVPGALAVERNVLEWRFDPRCPARLPQAVDYDVPMVILCQEGYTSSLAAAALQDLGLHRATDVVGGFAAWRIAGLPTLGPTPPHRPSSAAPPVTAGRAPR